MIFFKALGGAGHLRDAFAPCTVALQNKLQYGARASCTVACFVINGNEQSFYGLVRVFFASGISCPFFENEKHHHFSVEPAVSQ